MMRAGRQEGSGGGMPPRPPLVVCEVRFRPRKRDFATFLRQFLLEVRTFFAENPDA